jgi:antitoxin component YwqK of YwqJK toxin-antitoxin module
MKPKEHVEYHRDGSVWARGFMVDGVPVGYWEWFRKDGTKMRSGWFDNGVQTGEWTTYDAAGAVYKVTKMKAAPASETRAARAKRAAPKSRNKPTV